MLLYPISMRISQFTSLSEIQSAFNNLFPFLKIEFASANRVFQFPMKDDVPEDAELDILPDMTVAVLESELKSRYGLPAQVYRKSGKLWLETSMTNQWTLKQQNEHGKEISDPEV